MMLVMKSTYVLSIILLAFIVEAVDASIECESVYRRHVNARACLLYNLNNCNTTNIFKQPGKQCLTSIIHSHSCQHYFNCSIQSNSSADISTNLSLSTTPTVPTDLSSSTRSTSTLSTTTIDPLHPTIQKIETHNKSKIINIIIFISGIYILLF